MLRPTVAGPAAHVAVGIGCARLGATAATAMMAAGHRHSRDDACQEAHRQDETTGSAGAVLHAACIGHAAPPGSTSTPAWPHCLPRLPISPRGTHRSPPARAGGTAGRWAFPGPWESAKPSPPTRPIRDHRRSSDGTSPAFPVGRRAVGLFPVPGNSVSPQASARKAAGTRGRSSSTTSPAASPCEPGRSRRRRRRGNRGPAPRSARAPRRRTARR